MRDGLGAGTGQTLPKKVARVEISHNYPADAGWGQFHQGTGVPQVRKQPCLKKAPLPLSSVVMIKIWGRPHGESRGLKGV